MSQKIQVREAEILMATLMEGKVIPTEEQILTSHQRIPMGSQPKDTSPPELQ